MLCYLLTYVKSTHSPIRLFPVFKCVKYALKQVFTYDTYGKSGSVRKVGRFWCKF
jgi:hypothetical protein